MAELLVCAECGSAPTPDQVKYATVRTGDTHYRALSHGMSRARPRASGGVKLRACGPWVASTSTPEQRAAAVQAWKAAKES